MTGLIPWNKVLLSFQSLEPLLLLLTFPTSFFRDWMPQWSSGLSSSSSNKLRTVLVLLLVPLSWDDEENKSECVTASWVDRLKGPSWKMETIRKNISKTWKCKFYSGPSQPHWHVPGHCSSSHLLPGNKTLRPILNQLLQWRVLCR